jgi:hypothetical protein
MATSIISAGDAANLGVQTTGGNDGVLVLRSGAAGAKVDALSIAASGTGAFVGEVTATGFTGTLDGVLGSGTPAAATVTTLAASGDLTANNFAGRNTIIGGDFTTNPWQRGTSFAAIAHEAYCADRWVPEYVTSGVITASKAADAPTAAQAGTFTQHCLSLAVTTADTSIAASDVFAIAQKIEGLNAASLGFGQAGTRYVTLSFWVKGTKTGIHCVGLKNGAANRTYVAEYTIDSTNTWEYKTITIPADTTGTWLYTNGIGIALTFALMAGSGWAISADTWTAGNDYATSNQVNALDSTSNTFKIALVQLEAGSVATTFDARSVGTELALCQRYYETGNTRWDGYSISGYYYGNYVTFKNSKRATPTVVLSHSSGAYFNSTPVVQNIAIDGFSGYETNGSGSNTQSHWLASWTSTSEL